MNNFLLLFVFLYCSTLNAQPGSDERRVNLKLYFFDKNINDSILFRKEKGKFISLHKKKKYEIEFYSYNYYDYKKDSLKKYNYFNLKKNKIFTSIYFPSMNIFNENKTKIEPLQDIIIIMRKNIKKMKIYLKLYNSKLINEMNKIDYDGTDDFFSFGSNIFLKIPFQEGTFEVTDAENPKLIRIKDE